MIFSMTGFATTITELETGSLTLELRAVNHRYLDLQLRLPDELRLLESAFREAITAQITRGKAECRISFSVRPNYLNQSPAHSAQVNQTLLHQLAKWNSEVRTILPEAAPLGVADILRWNGVIQMTAASDDNLQAAALQALQQTLAEFTAARAREGEKLVDFLAQRVAQITVLCAKIAPRIPAAIAAYEERLTARLYAALRNNDDERIRQEITLFASKIDVDEELSRLQTHLDEVQRVLAQGGVVGKRLDFLMQELHREANTLGAKSVDSEVSYAAMEMKLLIEQMREQIQNIE